MGISLNQNDSFTIKDSAGNIKFSLDRRMPHMIHDITGTVTVPLIYTPEVDYNTQVIERTDELVVLANTYITNNVEDSFILPFYSITGGFADTGGKITPGSPSILIRKILQPTTKDFLGSTILEIIQENNLLKLVSRNNIDKTGFKNIDGDVSVTVSYRIYYGRFT
jgi:hypothetical protein